MHVIYETSHFLFYLCVCVCVCVCVLIAYPGLVMNSGPLAGLVVVVMTQKNHYHVAQAERRLLEIETDLRTLGVVRIHVCVYDM